MSVNMENYNSKEELEAIIEQEIDFEKLNELCEHITNAITEILTSCGLYFRIFSSVKSVESIASKLYRGKYGTLNNPKKIQDLIGLRVILYYYDDLSICRDIMERTFQMIDEWSRNFFESDEFRATKINGVFKYPAEYFNLYTKEMWSLPIDTTFEMQFRTVFFEGWHEIEHDMRYKSRISDDQFWKGSEELSRMLNCILANLELSDWSLVKLFEELSYNHYKNMNWELMLKSHFRIKLEDSAHLHPDIIAIFNQDKEIAKQFYKCPRIILIRELLKLDNPVIDYNLIIKLVNNNLVKTQLIRLVCDKIDEPHDSRIYKKETLARLESNILFHLELPLLHKESRTLETEFINSCAIVYKWARFKMNPVFEDMPEEVISYKNKLPGYQLKIQYDVDDLTFHMKISYIDSKHIGTLWHIHTSIAKLDDGRLHFYHMTSKDLPRSISQKETFLKPSFLSDLSNKTGIVDVIRLGNKAVFVTDDNDYSDFYSLIKNTERKLPIIAIAQQLSEDDTNTGQKKNEEYKDGYDMNTFTINGTRLAKVIGQYSHVFMTDRALVSKFAQSFNIPEANADGCICIFWPAHTQKHFTLFTRRMILESQFDFNRFAFHDEDVYEKAFRHKLVQIIKEDNISR